MRRGGGCRGAFQKWQVRATQETFASLPPSIVSYAVVFCLACPIPPSTSIHSPKIDLGTLELESRVFLFLDAKRRDPGGTKEVGGGPVGRRGAARRGAGRGHRPLPSVHGSRPNGRPPSGQGPGQPWNSAGSRPLPVGQALEKREDARTRRKPRSRLGTVGEGGNPLSS